MEIKIVSPGDTMASTVDNKTGLQALALVNYCYKYIMDLTTNGVVIADAIKFVQINKEKLTMSGKEDNNGSKESREPDYNEDKDQLEEEQEEKQQTTYFNPINIIMDTP